MSEMIERVAKALNELEGIHVMPQVWHYYEAKAVILAMQEPTQAMIDAGCEGRYDPVLVKAVWLNMINAALL